MRLLPLLLIGALVFPGRLSSQAAAPDTGTVTCPSGLTAATTKVCGAALDGVRMLHPLGGLLLSGGNPVIGTAEAAGAGRFGHVHLLLRSTTALVVFPDLGYDGSSDTVAVDHKVQLFAPRLDVALGLLRKELPMGTVAVDLLGSALVFPVSSTTTFRPVPGSRMVQGAAIGFGYGFRAAMIPAGAMPNASLSVVKRDAPTVTYGSLDGDRHAAYTFNVSAISVRLLAGKRIGIIDLSAGGGADLMSGNATVAFEDPETGVAKAPLETKLSTMRIATLFNAGLNLGPLRLSGELGYQVGKNEGYETRFAENDLRGGKFFGGFGIGIGM